MAKSDLKQRAKALYEQGIPLTDIASQLNVSPGTVRSWKSRGKWDAVATPRSVAEKRCNATDTNAKLIQSVEENPKLTDQQRIFCLHYVKTFHATNSAIRAGYSPESAGQIGYQLLQKTSIRAEITRLKEIRATAMLVSVDDVVEKYMHIAFADITDFLDFGRAWVPVMGPFGPIQIAVPDSDTKVTLTKEINEVRFKESSEVDGTLLSEVKQGKDGASVKLSDRMKALAWLSDYFEMNPMDKHKIEFDNKKIQLEQQKLISTVPQQETDDDPITKSLKEDLDDGIL